MAPQTKINKYLQSEAKLWSLPNHVTKQICLLAGREASAALRIALGRHPGATAAIEATFHEPFTYWDWHGVSADDSYAKKWKRQRIWEHDRGPQVNGTVYGYPTPRERWQAFKSNVETDRKRVRWVKRIAVAHWMIMENLNWCVNSSLLCVRGCVFSQLTQILQDRVQSH
jgi:hypothetical protein